jgi:hypothetical protein
MEVLPGGKYHADFIDESLHCFNSLRALLESFSLSGGE